MRLLKKSFSKSIPPSLLLGVSLVFGARGQAQTPVPSNARHVFARFLAFNRQQKLNSGAAKSLLTGEATRFAEAPSIGSLSAPNAFAIIDSRHLVARVQGLNGKTPVADVYFYLSLSGSAWKVSALRSMALTGMIEMAQRELQKKPTLTNQERSQLAILNLTLSLDQELRRHFLTRRAQFEQLLKLAPAKTGTTQNSVAQLGLSAIYKRAGGNTEFVIGGVSDNTVGYLYAPSNHPPRVSPDNYIWIEKLAAKWYLFRTT